ncbi:hypothetical protein [Empedobacter sp. GD03865]|uniref:hypothetical protein n=1 Tax=Empedobacter sp. GD03865 TaxID=2975392 RepID=UPI0024477C1C|nr:hypothetical protein [Empedobacter sp. GD03865]MDH0660726.1 hypothetical protein [Empedobacter sp. GD03865]
MSLIDDLVKDYLINANGEKKKFELPNNIKLNGIENFLKGVSFIFDLEGTKTKNYILDLSHIKKTNVLGMLLIYKVLEFTVKKKCFHRPVIAYEPYISNSWSKYGFISLINAYIESSDTSKELLEMNINITDHFIIAPQPLIRVNNFSNNFLKSTFLPKLNEYYQGKSKVVSMISTCFSEILLNFWEHAVDDTESVMIADGREQFIEIACADTGNGIISTLKKNKNYTNLTGIELIKMCINKDITSKEGTNHMGYGLWIINEICRSVKGRFHLYSEGFCYILDKDKVIVKEVPYWKGTIVYLALPLSNPISLEDISSLAKYKETDFKVAFI